MVRWRFCTYSLVIHRNVAGWRSMATSTRAGSWHVPRPAAVVRIRVGTSIVLHIVCGLCWRYVCVSVAGTGTGTGTSSQGRLAHQLRVCEYGYRGSRAPKPSRARALDTGTEPDPAPAPPKANQIRPRDGRNRTEFGLGICKPNPGLGMYSRRYRTDRNDSSTTSWSQ